ncbi:MAG: RNA 2',3'-cyclic phosphodiesterase [Planctomycetes bacterium]|nr:RNA 2',3'-cyclic phosphodiesterase [Planctomycetota bacterium]
MRLFIAIVLEPDIRSAIAKIQRELDQHIFGINPAIRRDSASLRWVEEANIHLTMRFLGETPDSKVAAISDAINSVAQSHHSFDMAIRGLGVFPALQKPRVIWVGCQEPTSTLPKVYEELEGNLVSLNLPRDDHPFSPHITIGRVKFIKNVSGLVGYLNTNKDRLIGRQMVNRLTLFSSTLTATGPIYKIIKEFILVN